MAEVYIFRAEVTPYASEWRKKNVKHVFAHNIFVKDGSIYVKQRTKWYSAYSISTGMSNTLRRNK